MMLSKMSKIVIVATIIAKEGEVALVKSELTKLVSPTNNEIGNVSHKIHQDIKMKTNL